MNSVSTTAFSIPSDSRPGGARVDAFGGRYYRIALSEAFPTFLMNVVSPSDLWLFLASNGGLTAGRIDADHAIFPYQCVDKVYDSISHTGPVTAAWVRRGAGEMLWEPFANHTSRHDSISRFVYKSVEGDRVWFEEINHELAIAFRYGWSTADDHGLIRRCELENLADKPVSIRLLDGLRNLLPPGIHVSVQNVTSCLADAYKTSALLPDSTLAVFSLAAGIVDRAIPMESMRASAVWSEGLPGMRIMLSDAAIPVFLAGGSPAPESRRRGIRCSYLLTSELALNPGARQEWLLVADTHLSQSQVAARYSAVSKGRASASVLADADAATRRLRSFVAAADGLQAGALSNTTDHHFANVLFNIMRGGFYAAGYEVPGRDFAAFVRIRNRAVAARHDTLLETLPESIRRTDLLSLLSKASDDNLERLGLEYLPLTFSRRHGDPSRPWNRFSICVRGDNGQRVLAYEGNWRDIFQNWESLCLSYPDFFESIAAKFVNASTADGYNPYRVTHAGIEWEEPEPANPWSSIGYWGDHQAIYLLKILEWSGRFHPGLLQGWLRRELFSYANVPYRIAGYAALRRDPHNTITFDSALNRTIAERVEKFGTDARLVRRPDGSIVHVNFAEKLLLLVLTRMTNFVPGGGIWMNTQRPDWNDANNALVGYGISMVTLFYLRRFLAYMDAEIVPALGRETVLISAPLLTLANSVLSALDAQRQLLQAPTIDAADRRRLLDALGAAGSAYRETIYRSGPGAKAPFQPAQFTSLVRLALEFVDHTIRANRREDGLYHAYNLLEFKESPPRLELHYLAPMLEGQVACLSSGLLSPAEAANLLQALRRSSLFRTDQYSYLLYPDRELPGFLERNRIPADAAEACPLLRELLAAGDTRLVLADINGQQRFHPDLVNRSALDERLAAIGNEPRWQARVQADAAEVHAIYERIFNHHAFTGRSGVMFGYEGLGCIYWHMVAKLLLAAQENLQRAIASSDPAAARLAKIYYDIRSGLGFNKTPAVYGAFPTDPYSHTPGHSGAQQPGMTGQVKEEILTRAGELGIAVSQGRLGFAPTFLLASEFTAEPATFDYFTLDGKEAALELPAGSLAFTAFGVPIVYHQDGADPEIILHESGSTRRIAGCTLDATTSAHLFARDGAIARVDVYLGPRFKAFSPG